MNNSLHENFFTSPPQKQDSIKPFLDSFPVVSIARRFYAVQELPSPLPLEVSSINCDHLSLPRPLPLDFLIWSNIDWLYWYSWCLSPLLGYI